MDPYAGLALGGAEVGKFIAGDNANKEAEAARLAALEAARKTLGEGYGKAESSITQGYSDASRQQKDVAGQIGEQGQDTFDAQQAIWAPWMIPGVNAYENLSKLISDPNAFNSAFAQYTASPEFQFRIDQAGKQVRRAASATGNRLGGAQMAALSDRANQVAGQGYEDWFDRMTRNLGTLAQTGFSAAGNLSGATDALGRTKIAALQYGDTSGLDLNKAKDVGRLAIDKAQDFSNLALGVGGVRANSALAKGQLQMGVMNDLAQMGGMMMGGLPTGGAAPAVSPGSSGLALSQGFTGGDLSGAMALA